jgi:hypothetical protein
MPTPTYVAIAKTVLTGTQATITFSGIPGSYTDLLLVYSARTNEAGNGYNDFKLTFNGLTTTIYSNTLIYGTPTETGSFRDTSSNNIDGSYVNVSGNTSNTFASGEIYIANYAGSTNKAVSGTSVTENNSSTIYQSIIAGMAGLFRDTGAITSLSIAAQGSTLFVSGSRFDLYGIKNS